MGSGLALALAPAPTLSQCAALGVELHGARAELELKEKVIQYVIARVALVGTRRTRCGG